MDRGHFRVSPVEWEQPSGSGGPALEGPHRSLSPGEEIQGAGWPCSRPLSGPAQAAGERSSHTCALPIMRSGR